MTKLNFKIVQGVTKITLFVLVILTWLVLGAMTFYLKG